MAISFHRLQSPTMLAVPFFMFGRSLDVIMLLVFALIRSRDAILYRYTDAALVMDISKAVAAIYTIFQVVKYFLGLKEPSTPSNDFPPKPMLFPCRTNHARLVPKINKFSYSYMLVGVPVGWKGSVGGMLSSDDPRKFRPWYLRFLSLEFPAWHTVNGDDYLGRGHVDGGLQEKLHNYLRGQGVDYKKYPYAYLLTAPRFLGYASNPLSIWNLYSPSRELKAFILEVNNTFDERHIYFVEPDLVPSTSPNQEAPPKLIQTWPKDFYVSTFNSRAGSYSISATDPLFPLMTNSGVVNLTVSLRSKHVSLVARIFSTGPAFDPSTMSVWEKTRFLAAWWWVGLATFPRTIVQALTLLLKHKLPWVFLPQPRRDTMPRHADGTEIFIERIFRKFLIRSVEMSDYPLVIKYSPAGLVDGMNETITSPSAQLADGKEVKNLELKVLSPGFYLRFLHYSCDFAESLILENESATIAISDLYLLFKLNPIAPRSQSPYPFERLRFWAIRTLRNSPLPIRTRESSAPPSPTAIEANTRETPPTKVDPTRLSAFESFILSQCSAEEKKEYASRVLKLFISEYIALGWMEILDLEIFLIRSRIAWVLAGLLAMP